MSDDKQPMGLIGDHETFCLEPRKTRGYFNTIDIVHRLLPPDVELLPNVHEIFELELAIGELSVLSNDEIIKRAAFFKSMNGRITNHYKLCMATPLQIYKQSSVRTQSFFLKHRFNTGYATHGLFPYRGKFHPQIVKGIMNLMQLQKGDIVLDPMVGSGTTCIEAQLLGINSIGVDISPFCCLMTQAKSDALDITHDELWECVKRSNQVFSFFDERRNSSPIVQNESWIDTRLYSSPRSLPYILFIKFNFIRKLI